MKDRVAVQTTRERALNTIIEVCDSLSKSKRIDVSSMPLECSVFEIVRETMRELASRSEWPFAEELLDEAMNQTQTEIDARLQRAEVSFSVHDLLELGKPTLAKTSKELSRLSTQLSESKAKRRVKEAYVDDGQTDRAVKFHQIGLEGAPTGLLAESPSEEVWSLNLERLTNAMSAGIVGDDFPYEVFVRDYVFVVDDDGSVFVSVDGLSLPVVEEVEGILREVVAALYS